VVKSDENLYRIRITDIIIGGYKLTGTNHLKVLFKKAIDDQNKKRRKKIDPVKEWWLPA